MVKMKELKNECPHTETFLKEVYSEYEDTPIDVIRICSKCHKPYTVRKEERDEQKS